MLSFTSILLRLVAEMVHPDAVPITDVSMDVKLSDFQVRGVAHVNVENQYTTKHDCVICDHILQWIHLETCQIEI